MDIYVDSTYSNDEFVLGCMDDVMTAAKLAAASRGTLKLHAFDGDPFRRRGISASFGDEEVPANIKGTSGETAHFEEDAEELQPEIEALIEKKPTKGGTPLVQLLKRVGRHTPQTQALDRMLVCTDGLFTDIKPKKVTAAEARDIGESLPASLRGTTVDFIGLDGSAPGRGEYIERTKPLVKSLFDGAGMKLGNWDLELPPSWREETIAAIEARTG